MGALVFVLALPVLTNDGDEPSRRVDAPSSTAPQSLSAASCRALAAARGTAQRAWRAYGELGDRRFPSRRAQLMIALSWYVRALERAERVVPADVESSLRVLRTRIVAARP